MQTGWVLCTPKVTAVEPRRAALWGDWHICPPSTLAGVSVAVRGVWGILAGYPPMARSRQGTPARMCECTYCDCPQDLRLKRGKRSRVCWYCDIGQHPAAPHSPPFFPEIEPTKPLISSPDHPLPVPQPSNSPERKPKPEVSPGGVGLRRGKN
jgi:hypothetical protein